MAYNLEYKKAEYTDTEPSFTQYFGAVAYQNKILSIEFSEAYNFEQATKRFVTRVLALFEDEPDEDVTYEDLKLFQYYYDDNLEGCKGYNTVAAKALDQLINDAQVK